MAIPQDVPQWQSQNGCSARPRRLRAAVCISTNWWRRATSIFSAWVFASGKGRKLGRTASAKCARTQASIVWVFSQLAGRASKVSYLARINGLHGQPSRSQRTNRGHGAVGRLP